MSFFQNSTFQAFNEEEPEVYQQNFSYFINEGISSDLNIDVGLLLLQTSNSTFQAFNEEETEAFKQNSSYFKDNFEGAFSNPVINWLLLFMYILGLFGCLGLLLVSWFEKTGQAGPFRTLVNQLISAKLDQIVIMFVFGTFIQSIRPVYGPMPHGVCRVSLAIQVFTGMNIILLSLSVTGARFAFVCVYKAMPTMNDDFLKKFIVRAITVWSAIATLFKHFFENKVMISERVCTGTWSDKDQEMSPIPVVVVVVACSFVLHAIMTIAIKLGKPVEAPQNNYQVGTNTDLASFLVGHLSTGSMFLIIAAYFGTIRLGTPKTLNEYPAAWLHHYYTSIGPTIMVWALCAAHYMKNPQVRKSVRRLFIPDRIVPIDNVNQTTTRRNQAEEDLQTYDNFIEPIA